MWPRVVGAAPVRGFTSICSKIGVPLAKFQSPWKTCCGRAPPIRESLSCSRLNSKPNLKALLPIDLGKDIAECKCILRQNSGRIVPLLRSVENILRAGQRKALDFNLWNGPVYLWIRCDAVVAVAGKIESRLVESIRVNGSHPGKETAGTKGFCAEVIHRPSRRRERLRKLCYRKSGRCWRQTNSCRCCNRREYCTDYRWWLRAERFARILQVRDAIETPANIFRGIAGSETGIVGAVGRIRRADVNAGAHHGAGLTGDHPKRATRLQQLLDAWSQAALLENRSHGRPTAGSEQQERRIAAFPHNRFRK